MRLKATSTVGWGRPGAFGPPFREFLCRRTKVALPSAPQSMGMRKVASLAKSLFGYAPLFQEMIILDPKCHL